MDLFPNYSGDPIDFRRRLAPQAALGIPPLAGFRDGRQWGGRLTIAPGFIDPQAVNPGGDPLDPLDGKAGLSAGDLSLGDLDPNDPHLLIILAAVFGKYSITAKQAGAYQQWRFDRGQATAADPYVAIRDFDAVKPETLWHDLAFGGLQIAAAANENLAVTAPGGQVAFGGYSFGGAARLSSGTGTDLPRPIGTWAQAWQEGDTDRSIFIRIITAPDADGVFTYDTMLGDAGTDPIVAAFPGNTYTGKVGKAFRLYAADGTRLGPLGAQAKAVLPDPAVAAVDSIYELPSRVDTPFTASLTPRHAISSVHTIVYYGGEEIRTEGGWTMRAFRQTIESIPDVAGRQSSTPRLSGPWNFEVEIERQLVDLLIQKGLHEGERVAVFVEAETPEAITGTTPPVPFRFLAGFPSCLPTGDMFSVEPGATNRTERVVLRAGEPAAGVAHAGITWDKAGGIVLDNERTAL